jgi:hypothetical protein
VSNRKNGAALQKSGASGRKGARMMKRVVIELPDSAGLLTVVAIGTQQINFQMRIMADQRIVTLTDQETELTIGEGWEDEK